MKGYKRWVHRCDSRYRWLPVAKMILLALLTAFLLYLLEYPPQWGLLWLLLFPAFLLSGAASSTILLTESVKPLHEACDPYPFLDETTIQLTYVKGKGERAVLTLNHAAALMETGRMEQAYALLTALPQSNLPNLPTVWLPFYLNLGQCELEVTGDVTRAQVWYEQTLKQLEEIKNPKQKAELADAVRLMYVELQIARGEFATALETLATVADKNLRRQVDKAWAYGRIAQAQGDVPGAVRNLEYVVACGNRLGLVQKARERLAQLSPT